jgi:hypothetical protein
MLYVLGYYFVNLVLHRVLPASVVEGTELASGGRHKYRLNGASSHFPQALRRPTPTPPPGIFLLVLT